MDIMEFILQNYVVVVVFAACFVIAEIVKGTEVIDIKYIPPMVAVLGVIFNTWFNHFEFTFPIFVGGLVSGWASVGAWETYKNIFKKGDR